MSDDGTPLSPVIYTPRLANVSLVPTRLTQCTSNDDFLTVEGAYWLQKADV